MAEEYPSVSPSERREFELAVSCALDCVKAQGFANVEATVSEGSDGHLSVVWGFDAGEDEDQVESAIEACEVENLLSLQASCGTRHFESDMARYRQLAECLDDQGIDLGEWNDDNLSSALSAARSQSESQYLECFHKIFLGPPTP